MKLEQNIDKSKLLSDEVSLPAEIVAAIGIMSNKYKAELKKNAKLIASGRGPSSKDTASALYELLRSIDKED